MTERIKPQFVRNQIALAQDALLDLAAYLTDTPTIDRVKVQLLASRAMVAMEAAANALSNAVCDIETAIDRL